MQFLSGALSFIDSWSLVKELQFNLICDNCLLCILSFDAWTSNCDELKCEWLFNILTLSTENKVKQQLYDAICHFFQPNRFDNPEIQYTWTIWLDWWWCQIKNMLEIKLTPSLFSYVLLFLDFFVRGFFYLTCNAKKQHPYNKRYTTRKTKLNKRPGKCQNIL